MKRGDLYRVYKPQGDPKRFRTYVIVSRRTLVDSLFSTVVCAPIFSNGQGLLTQVAVGPAEGLKYSSWIICDGLMSVRKSELTNYVGSLSKLKLAELEDALRAALDLR